MESSSKVKQVFFTALVASVLIVGAYVYTFVLILDKNRQVSEFSASVQNLTEQKNNLISLKDRAKNTEKERSQIDSYFVSQNGVVAFLNRIQSLAEENGLDMAVSSVAIGDSPISPDIFEIIKLSFTCIGEWSDAYRFMSLIDVMPLRIFVDNAGVEVLADIDTLDNASLSSKKKATSSRPLWKASFDLRVMKLK